MLKKYKSPQELVKKTKESLEKIQEGKKIQEDLTKHLQTLKQVLCGPVGEGDSQAEAQAQVSQEMYSTDLLQSLVANLAKVDFESKKDIVQIFAGTLRRQTAGRHPTVEYLGQGKNSQLLIDLVHGYGNPEIALHVGQMLRECIKHDTLAKIIVNDPAFYEFFNHVQVSTFDVASDAFTTFKELLTKHKIICAEFLEKNYDKVFGTYVQLLNSENYVTRRQSLKLLGELLLDRANFSIMTKYISNPENLKLMMNMLRDKSRNIQFEAFHVFKVFVANPNKAKPILEILLKNKEKLKEFLEAFHTDRSEDEQFNDEKKYLIKQINDLK
eukprot:m.69311 g.69311  ORF g.69311 m.69311 type:complete len:327 (-) comp14241_c0_seq1:1080-2060(-)